jgi:hypothetical protein
LAFTSPFGDRTYFVETATNLDRGHWTTAPNATLRQTGDSTYQAQCPATNANPQFYRIGVRP